MRTIEVHLGYFKQGDDLHFCIENTKTPIEALDQDAENLVAVSQHLKSIADILRKHHHRIKDINLHADTHYIAIECPDDIADELVEAKLGHFPEWEDEEEEQWDEQYEDADESI